MEHSRKLCLLAFILATNNVVALLSTTNDENNNTNNNNKVINKRHTPFLPGDYWKDKRPEFGDTQTDIEVMVNGTARLKCPITHVADSSVSINTFSLKLLQIFVYNCIPSPKVLYYTNVYEHKSFTNVLNWLAVE